MRTKTVNTIIVETTVNAPVEKVWEFWISPRHIVKWNFANSDWHSPRAVNNLKKGGRFNYRMEAKDKSAGFDFSGRYNYVKKHRSIEYVLEDGRKVQVDFLPAGNKTSISERFQAEADNSLEMQREGWQAILNNFKKYVENSGSRQSQHFEILIDAPVEMVYNTMISEEYYPEWTSPFNPSSHFKGTWAEGEKIIFIGDDPDGGTGGMISRIRENRLNEFISIEHLGIIKENKEVTSGPGMDQWKGLRENYTFKDKNGKTLLQIDADTIDEFAEFMKLTWPKALEKLKEICETLNRNK